MTPTALAATATPWAFTFEPLFAVVAVVAGLAWVRAWRRESTPNPWWRPVCFGAGLALGGVAHKPWRARHAERLLTGERASEAVFQRAVESELVEARGFAHNSFKIELVKRTIVSVLRELTEPGGAR